MKLLVILFLIKLYARKNIFNIMTSLTNIYTLENEHYYAFTTNSFLYKLLL